MVLEGGGVGNGSGCERDGSRQAGVIAWNTGRSRSLGPRSP